MAASDKRRTEMHGLHEVALSLVDAGYEVAVPRWDDGVDLIAFKSKPKFIARPLQIKAAATFRFGAWTKYRKFPGLLMVYVTDLHSTRGPTIYAMPCEKADRIIRRRHGHTDSYKGDGYSTTAENVRPEIARWEMVTPARWKLLLERNR